MATLTIADLDNGKRDLETVDAVANSQADTTPTRYGQQTLTLAGALRRLGYAPPVAYAPGLTVDSPLFTVSYGDPAIVYAPDPALVPFTTAAWDANQWRPIQSDVGLRQDLSAPTGSELVGFTRAPGVVRTVGDKLADTVTIRDLRSNNFDQDLGPLIQTFFDSAPPGSKLDLLGMKIGIATPIVLPDGGMQVANGAVNILGSQNFLYAFVPGEESVFDRVGAIGSGVIGSSGSVLYQGLAHSGGSANTQTHLKRPPRNRVKFLNCYARDLTVGIFAGGSSTDPILEEWDFLNFSTYNIVGFPGNSEGYGLLLTPASKCTVQGLRSKKTRRHALYLAGGACDNQIIAPQIFDTDNLAIQFNAYTDQSGNDRNIIIAPMIYGVTRSTPYGYRSSVGIGMYGKASGNQVLGGRIEGVLDTGIDIATAYATGVDNMVRGTFIDATNAIDAALRLENQSGGDFEYKANLGTCYGAVTAGVFGNKVTSIRAALHSTNAGSSLLRAAHSGGTVEAYRWALSGVETTTPINASAGAVVKTDLNSRASYLSSNSDVTHTPQGTGPLDGRFIRDAATLTADRKISLTEGRCAPGTEVTIMRTGTGFTRQVYSGAGLVKALAANQWGRFAVNASNQWELVGFGSL